MLSDYEIVMRMNESDDRRAIVVTPLLSPRQLQPASIDLRLGFHFKTVRNTRFAALDPLAKSAEDLRLDTERYTDDIKTLAGEPFFMHPGEFALATTLEYIKLPTDIAATLEGRSSLGRLGVTVHSTAGFIDPGFRGRITYEMQNEGRQTVALYPGMRVAQLCFIELGLGSIRPYSRKSGSKYENQLTTTSSRWYLDPELEFLRRRYGYRHSAEAL